jgi:hypothetical protein
VSAPAPGEPEPIDFEHVLEFYQAELTDKTQKLALAHGQIKNRDNEIERLKRRVAELEQ